MPHGRFAGYASVHVVVVNWLEIVEKFVFECLVFSISAKLKIFQVKNALREKYAER